MYSRQSALEYVSGYQMTRILSDTYYLLPYDLQQLPTINQSFDWSVGWSHHGYSLWSPIIKIHNTLMIYHNILYIDNKVWMHRDNWWRNHPLLPNLMKKLHYIRNWNCGRICRGIIKGGGDNSKIDENTWKNFPVGGNLEPQQQ